VHTPTPVEEPSTLPAVREPEPTPSREAQPTPDPASENPPPAPADLASLAPNIGKAAPAQLGIVSAGISLRPPAIALDGTEAGGYRVAAASMIGASHVHNGQPRQDAYNFLIGASGRLYVTIADGLGSKPNSQLGAHLFTESVLIAAAHAEAGELEPDPTRLLLAAGERMERLVGDAYGVDPKSAACVGAVAIFDENGCVVARIGDVSAFVLRDGDFDECFATDDGPLNKVSASLPHAEEASVEVAELGPEAIVVFGTDGLAGDIRNSEALREWLGEKWRVPHLPFGIGDTLRYRRRGSHDDRTAVVVWRTA
jgi:hypothetical protein